MESKKSQENLITNSLINIAFGTNSNWLATAFLNQKLYEYSINKNKKHLQTIFNNKKTRLPEARLITSDFTNSYSLKYKEDFYKKVKSKDLQFKMDDKLGYNDMYQKLAKQIPMMNQNQGEDYDDQILIDKIYQKENIISGTKEQKLQKQKLKPEESPANWYQARKFEVNQRSKLLVPLLLEDEFLIYSGGKSISVDKLDYLEESLRFQIEDSDTILGFNLYIDVQNGFDSIGHWTLDYLSEEVPKAGIILKAVMDSSQPQNKFEEEIMQINTAWALGELNEYVTALLPMEMNNLLQFPRLNQQIISKKEYTTQVSGYIDSVLLQPFTVQINNLSNLIFERNRGQIRQLFEPMKISPRLNIFQIVSSIPSIGNKKTFLRNNLQNKIINNQKLKKILKGQEEEIDELWKYKAFEDNITEFKNHSMFHFSKGDQMYKLSNKNAYKTKQEIMCLNQKLFEKEMIINYGEYQQFKKRYVLKEFPLDVSIYNDLQFKNFINYYTNLVKKMSPRAKFTYEKAGIIIDDFKELYEKLACFYD